MELIFSDCVKQTTAHDSQNAVIGANVLEMNQINIPSSKKISKKPFFIILIFSQHEYLSLFIISITFEQRCC
ncbi:hypothetical protein UNH65_25640 [Chitinophaga sp. 180180018-2]|nr:hypothetical protein [Chitinophaga sp. 212800010-3]